MRHSDAKLTTKTYTDAGHLPLRSSVLKICSINSTATDTRADTQNGVKTHEKRVSSVLGEKSRLTEDDLEWRDAEEWRSFDTQWNIADWTLRLLGGGVKHSGLGMVRDAGFEPAALPCKINGSSAMTHEHTRQLCEIMTLWGCLPQNVCRSLLTLIRAQACSVPEKKEK